ncbi:amidohydrolase family [Actinidia rufa]|uniref:Amidohydrolase family n=1 Tax=Actinidia rufa TaxID=165716 RepID=A0A7J0EVW3_9ERIC|nr:amidohydrolase family [Actinidia rufa]
MAPGYWVVDGIMIFGEENYQSPPGLMTLRLTILMDGHMGLANSLALKIAGITNYTEDPNGGAIMRTADGVTHVGDMTMFPSYSSVKCLPQDLIHEKGRKLSQLLYLGGVKAFSDGSLGSNSALFYEPYIDDPQNCGLQVTDMESLLNMTIASDKSELQVAIHAIGDRANDLILDIYKSVVSTNRMRDRRLSMLSIWHLGHQPGARFGEEGIVASVQAVNSRITYWMMLILQKRKLGAERAQIGSYLFQSLLASNALLAFGSDWPVVDINPLRSIKDSGHEKNTPWYTISAARACFLDEDVGSLSPGKFADFVVLSTDSWDDFVTEGSSSVEATYVGGIQAYP